MLLLAGQSAGRAWSLDGDHGPIHILNYILRFSFVFVRSSMHCTKEFNTFRTLSGSLLLRWLLCLVLFCGYLKDTPAHSLRFANSLASFLLLSDFIKSRNSDFFSFSVFCVSVSLF